MSALPRDVAVAMYEALLRSDRDALQALTEPEIEIHVTKELPYGGDYFGLPASSTCSRTPSI